MSRAGSFDAVEARGLTKVYGRQRALAGVDLTLRAGEATALLGPNGAGKSTLVGILATLVSPTAGTVRYGGSEAGDDALRASIGVIAHESHCYGDLDRPREPDLLRAPLRRVRGAAPPPTRCSSASASATPPAAPARTYSRGMLQRLAVARALVHQPRLLLADEPFTGLDRAGVALLAELLAEERARGCIMVVVTHDFDAVASLVDRVVVLARGRIAHDAAHRRRARRVALAEVVSRGGTLMTVLRAIGLLLWKDVVVELRAKELVYATIFFAAVVLLVFCFAFLGGPKPTVDVAAGVLWVAIALAGTVGISRAFEREREGDTLRALLLAPVPRTALYLSKLAAISLLMLLVETVALSLVSLLFGISLGAGLPTLVALLVLGTIGFARRRCALRRFARPRPLARRAACRCWSIRSSCRCSSPARAARSPLLIGAEPAVAAFWLKFLLVFDAVFVSLGVWVFEPLVAGDA